MTQIILTGFKMAFTLASMDKKSNLWEVKIIVPGDARGKGRPRFSPGQGRAYTDDKTRSAEGIIATFGALAMRGQPPRLESLDMLIHVVVAIPDSWSKKRKIAALEGLEFPAKKPDLDNIAKLLGDSLNGIVFKDDAQIVYLEALKTYGDVPITTIIIRTHTKETKNAQN